MFWTTASTVADRRARTATATTPRPFRVRNALTQLNTYIEQAPGDRGGLRYCPFYTNAKRTDEAGTFMCLALVGEYDKWIPATIDSHLSISNQEFFLHLIAADADTKQRKWLDYFDPISSMSKSTIDAIAEKKYFHTMRNMTQLLDLLVVVQKYSQKDDKTDVFGGIMDFNYLNLAKQPLDLWKGRWKVTRQIIEYLRQNNITINDLKLTVDRLPIFWNEKFMEFYKFPDDRWEEAITYNLYQYIEIYYNKDSTLSLADIPSPINSIEMLQAVRSAFLKSPHNEQRSIDMQLFDTLLQSNPHNTNVLIQQLHNLGDLIENQIIIYFCRMETNIQEEVVLKLDDNSFKKELIKKIDLDEKKCFLCGLQLEKGHALDHYFNCFKRASNLLEPTKPKKPFSMMTNTEIFEKNFQVLQTIRNHPLIEGETWYVVEDGWFKSFRDFGMCNCKPESAPKMIDNSSLVHKDNPSMLLQTSKESINFEVIPEIRYFLLYYYNSSMYMQSSIGHLSPQQIEFINMLNASSNGGGGNSSSNNTSHSSTTTTTTTTNNVALPANPMTTSSGSIIFGSPPQSQVQQQLQQQQLDDITISICPIGIKAYGVLPPFLMRKHTLFKRLFVHVSNRFCIDESELIFFFQDKLNPEQCPSDIGLATGDIIVVRRVSHRPLKSSTDPTKSSLTSSFIEDIKALYNSEEFSDITFALDDGSTLPAHKNILSARCEKFKAMFSNQMKESREAELKVTEYKAIIFKKMIEYLYTDKIEKDKEENLDIDTIMQLIVIADDYLLDSLKTQCETKLIVEINLSNVGSFLSHSDIYNCKVLKKHTLSFILSSIKKLVGTKEFEKDLLSSSTSLLYEIIKEMAPTFDLGRKKKEYSEIG
ncbi:hypothetical protein DFA_01803 [Cavenderia fasciculata]|uniref:BTB domain-containing protein n=1 Tax=Cavenderia fasciculata TaxID=261658 RepID=F4PUV5_CACFS|nr:uncharacterized protein DFA_01803 [Cavenderia fasciculata]EGG21917.1 hypothetical protein DFA_01803 [Cavenderia fasciculata]|eukprot:XP_004359768.1 hypothetical protein DFA_01803 [Cavenderia fasciculata]